MIRVAGSALLGLEAEQGPDFGRQRDRLLAAREDAAALRDQLAVIIVPARARQVEQAVALLPARRRIGIGIEEDVAVVEGGDQLDRLATAACRCRTRRPTCRRRPATRIGCGLDVDAHFAEMALDRDPGAAGGDPHRLVVVALASAGGEGVAEPEAALGRDRVGDVGEGRGALVGGDDEIGIVAVEDDDAVRMDDLVADDIVGDRQQGADEDPVAFRAFGEPGVAVGHRRQLLGIEAALGAGRDDHRILDQLRLHQAQYLGPEIVAPVGPSEAAAGDRAAAQVDALDPRRIDPDLAPRQRLAAGSAPCALSSLKASASRPAAAKALVRRVAAMTPWSSRRMRSSSIAATWARPSRIARSAASIAASRGRLHARDRGARRTGR